MYILILYTHIYVNANEYALSQALHSSSARSNFVFTMLQEFLFLSQNLKEALQKQGNGAVAVVVLQMPFAV